jgi:hypothetical protein
MAVVVSLCGGLVLTASTHWSALLFSHRLLGLPKRCDDA